MGPQVKGGNHCGGSPLRPTRALTKSRDEVPSYTISVDFDLVSVVGGSDGFRQAFVIFKRG